MLRDAPPEIRHSFYVLMILGVAASLVGGWFAAKLFYGERMEIQASQLNHISRIFGSIDPAEIVKKLDGERKKGNENSLIKPRVKILERHVDDLPEDKFKFQEIIMIISELRPNGLIVEVYSGNIIEGRIHSHHTSRDLNHLQPGPYDNKNTWSRMIPEPYGAYTITIVTEGMERADFNYRFSVPGTRNGTR